ncbi:hypothetical protein AAC03nite_13250 [Alicyclobacillus acidoterrestris]|nr:hypothetical protein AAC03nite_13250 [Alicyclobacillus acidoterrestris]
MRRPRQWLLSALVIVIVGIIYFRSGGQVPLPDHYQKTANGVRITANMVDIPPDSTGEQWNLTHNQAGAYYVNMYLNGRERRTFTSRKVLHKTADGTLYQTAGIIKFGQQQYHAVDIFVKTGGKSGYIDFTKG